MHAKVIQASLLVAISGILYGFLGYLGTEVLRDNLSISTMLFWRFLIAGLWMYLFSLKKYIKPRSGPKANPRIVLYMFLLGAIGYSGSSGFYFLATRYTGTGLAMVIFFSYPIMVALYSWIRHGKSLSALTLITLLCMIVGLLLLRDSSAITMDYLGIIFAILAAASYAFYVIGSKYFSSAMLDSNLLTMTVCFGSTLLFFILSISTHSFAFPHTLHGWIYVIALGVLATALPIQLMLEGLKYISSMRASIISVLEPLVTIIVGVILLHEAVSGLQMLGTFIILASAIIVQFQREL